MTKYRIIQRYSKEGVPYFTIQYRLFFIWHDCLEYKYDDFPDGYSYKYSVLKKYDCIEDAELFIKSRGKEVVSEYKVRN